MTRRILNTITEYVEPSDLFTEEEQLDQCCERVSADPCVEVGRVDPYISADTADLNLEKLLNEARAAHPGVKIVGVQVVDKGPSGDCGTMYTDWSGRENCCDEVEPLAWDYENSAEVIDDFSAASVAVVGGRFPLAVKVRGSGFYLGSDKKARDGVVNSGDIIISTLEACGTCSIFVSDGCTTVVGKVRSTNGMTSALRDITNSSYVGNLFWQINGIVTATNDWLYNHYIYSITIDNPDSCTPTSAETSNGKDCPRLVSDMLDSGSSTASHGTGVVDISTPGAADFGYPIVGSDLIDAFPSSLTVPADLFGVARGSTSDIGALEYAEGEPTSRGDCTGGNSPVTGGTTPMIIN